MLPSLHTRASACGPPPSREPFAAVAVAAAAEPFANVAVTAAAEPAAEPATSVAPSALTAPLHAASVAAAVEPATEPAAALALAAAFPSTDNAPPRPFGTPSVAELASKAAERRCVTAATDATTSCVAHRADRAETIYRGI